MLSCVIYYLLDLLYYIVPVYYNLQGFTQLELHSWQHDTRKKCWNPPPSCLAAEKVQDLTDPSNWLRFVQVRMPYSASEHQ